MQVNRLYVVGLGEGSEQRVSGGTGSPGDLKEPRLNVGQHLKFISATIRICGAGALTTGSVEVTPSSPHGSLSAPKLASPRLAATWKLVNQMKEMSLGLSKAG